VNKIISNCSYDVHNYHELWWQLVNFKSMHYAGAELEIHNFILKNF
jgi:hypothetical protein